MLRVQLLGEPAVERDGTPLTLPLPQRRLLVALALERGLLERDRLAARFWPDAPEPVARANLRTTLWGLRRAIGDDVVVTTRTAVGLCPGRVETDLARIGGLAAGGDPQAAAAACGGARLLEGWTQEWVERARAEHRTNLIGLLDAASAAAERDGDAPDAVRWSRRRCALAPLDEPAHRELVRRLVAAGDRAGAVVAGRELADRLRDELGVPPDAATRAALAALRGPAAASPVAGAGRGALFGRAAELRALTDAWTATRAGRGRVVVLTGEAGIGKTRLVTELAARADDSGGRTAVGAGVDVGGETPLAVWHELARALVRTVPAPPSHAHWPAELGRLAPDLARALGHHDVPAAVAAPELERLRVWDAVLRLVEWAASGRPVLLVAEDVHRADRASLALSTHIGRRLAELPVLFVLTRRDRPARPEPDALVADLAGRGVPVEGLTVGPLADTALAEVARTAAVLDDDGVDRAVRAAEGNPLLAVESARALASGLGTGLASATLRAGVRTTLRAVDDPVRDLLEILAVAGRSLAPPEVAALELPGATRTEHRALDTGLVVRASSGLRYRHALLAEAARAELDDPGGGHHRLAVAVERAATDPGAVAAEVATHLRAAGRDDLAGPRWERAARAARTVGALPEATSFWEQAVRARPRLGRLRLELAEVHGWSGRSAEFEREWWTAMELLTPAELTAAWCRRGTVLRTVVCRPAASLEAYRRAFGLLGPDTADELRREVLLGLAWAESTVADPQRAEALLADVVRLAVEPDDSTVAAIESVRVMTVIRLGRFGDVAAAADRGGAAAGRARRPDLAYPIRGNAACALSAAGDDPGALAQSAAAVAETRGIAVLEQPCLAALALLLGRCGRHEEAARVAAEQLAMAERMDTPDHVMAARHDAGLVALAAGRHTDAARLLAAALDDPASTGADLRAQRVSRPAARLSRAEALVAGGRAGEAEAEIRRATGEPVRPEDRPWALVGRMARVQGLVAAARGDRDLAVRRLREALAGWRRQRPPDPGTEYMTNFVDLGRPPVAGLVEPEREIARLVAELRAAGADPDEEERRCPDSS